MNLLKVSSKTIYLLLLAAISCKTKEDKVSTQLIGEIKLKRGAIISCGAPGQEYGTLAFEVTGTSKAKEEFQLALKMLHSFEYDEAEKVFASVIDEDPNCAMAYWGVAMSNFHPLWAPPTTDELKKGSKAIEIANSISNKTEREKAYIDAIGAFYHDWEKTPHKVRCQQFRDAMEKLNATHASDRETAIFYALSLVAAADPKDKTYASQQKAGTILNGLYPKEPNHPGIIHYIIHTYDSPELAHLALDAARKYASVAPSSAHAQHMPSHVFVRLGLWEECIRSNQSSISSAKCYAEQAGIKGHWDEELHALDYLTYAYLQLGNNKEALAQLEYLRTIKQVYPTNFKVLYSFASIPSRYYLENRMWNEAAKMEMLPADFPWKDFPWQRSLVHFTKALGSIHTGDLATAKNELKELETLKQELDKQKDEYKSGQVVVSIKTISAWIKFKEGDKAGAVKLMTEAADIEDNTQKLPVTPGEILPARELLADMLMELNKWGEALEAYEQDLRLHPNRLNGLKGARMAADLMGNSGKVSYYNQLIP